MKKRHKVIALAAMALFASSVAHAGPRCHVPLGEWQTRDALQEKIRALGWTISRIKTDDGCYKVYGTNEKGQRVKAKFNPATLELIKRDDDD